MKKSSRYDPPSHGLNIFPFASMAGGWLGPLLMFWLYVWGPLRPFAYPAGQMLPGAWFAVVVAACFSLWWVLPRGYFETRAFERSGRVYRVLGVLVFRRFAPDGDLANQWERRANPHHRIIGGQRSAVEFITRTEQSERGHLVLLALGIASAAYAWRLGWQGWAVYLSVGNVVVNLYAILLQRYTRSRIRAMLHRARRTLGGSHAA